MNSSKRNWSSCSLATMAALLVFAYPNCPLYGQLILPSTLNFQGSSTPVDDRTAKIQLALETARVAAEAEMFDLSFEAVRRVCADGPPIAKPQIQSSLLGGQTNAPTRIVTGRPGFEVPEATLQYSAKLFSIVDKWNAKKAPIDKVSQALEQMVFPATRPNEIMLFSNAPPTNTNSYSYEFSFAKPKSIRYLAFELIDLASKNETLPSLIEKVEKMRSQPGSQVHAIAMLIYAKRVSAQADAAATALDELLANPVADDHTMALYCALTQPVPGAGESTVVPAATSLPLLNKLLKQSVMRTDIRRANDVRALIAQQLRLAIEAENQTAFDAYVEMVVESANQMQGSNQNTIDYILESFYRNLTEECKRQGKAAMAVDVSSRAVDVRTNLEPGSALAAGTITNYADLKPEVRLKALRKMLVERPLVKFEQFSFTSNPQRSNIPEFFQITSTNDKLKQFSPYEGAKAISLLDLLLNQTEAEGDYAALVKELIANANENEDVKRFLAVWLNFRNEMRGKPVDAELAKLANFESEKEYLDWWKLLPTPAALELVSLRIRKEAPSAEFRSAFDSRFANQQPTQAAIEMRYQQRLAVDKTLVNANHLKHWVVSYEPINFQQEDQPSLWTINDKRQLECFGGAWYGQLIFRYPMPMNSSIRVTADLSDKKTDGLYCGGVSMMSFDEQQGAGYAMASNVRVLGQFNAKSAKPTRMLEGTIKESSLTLKCGDKTVEVHDYGAKTVPFVGLASYGAKQSAYSEIALSAPAPIPREVSLLDEGLAGWSAYLFGHMLPKLPGHIETEASDVQSYDTPQDGASPMWSLVDNEIRAGKVKSEEDDAKSAEETEDVSSEPELAARNATTSQSNLSYCRPLCEGERIEYEFFHQPEVQNASPSVGRIAYMIRDGKISLRWISTATEALKPNTESNNLGDDPAAEVLAPIMLEVNAWNRVQLRIEGGKVVLSVAGTDVYRRPFEKDTVARFGFYCDPAKDQVRVRNVVLKGDWPTEVPADLWELK